jgi:hypothetical protein
MEMTFYLNPAASVIGIAFEEKDLWMVKLPADNVSPPELVDFRQFESKVTGINSKGYMSALLITTHYDGNLIIDPN